MCFYQPVSKLVMFEHQGGGIVFSMCLVFHLRDRTECDYSPIGGGPACPGYGPGCQTVGRHSLVARPSPSTPSPPTPSTPHSPISKIYERGLRELGVRTLLC